MSLNLQTITDKLNAAVLDRRLLTAYRRFAVNITLLDKEPVSIEHLQQLIEIHKRELLADIDREYIAFQEDQRNA